MKKILLAVLILSIGFISCKKESIIKNDASKTYVRIQEVDNDGTEQTSNIIVTNVK